MLELLVIYPQALNLGELELEMMISLFNLENFRDVDAPGGNIKDQFQMLPFKEPSVTLFNLMGFVVNAGQRFASITDMATGSDVQNRAVGTTVALLERGSRVMTAIHKRCYYAMRNEFRLMSKVLPHFYHPFILTLFMEPIEW